MKHCFFFAFIFSITTIFSQDCLPFTQNEWLKASEIEIVTGNIFPEKYVIIGVASFERSEGIISLETLTPKMIKSMKKLAVALHCSKVFVDFKDLIGNFKDAEGRSMHETHIHYYMIRPLLYICKSSKPEQNE